jgi:hypothetical protein
MPKENDLEGPQDEGGKHGGQKGMPKPERPPNRDGKRDGDEAPKAKSNRQTRPSRPGP